MDGLKLNPILKKNFKLKTWILRLLPSQKKKRLSDHLDTNMFVFVSMLAFFVWVPCTIHGIYKYGFQ